MNTSLSLYEDVDKKRKSHFANCKSIVLTPSEKDMSETLNLSPFIIDKNTFLDNNHIDLFLYAYEGDGHYHYLAVKHSLFVALENEKGTDIIDTSMTSKDFEEGRNINRDEAKLEDDFGFSEAFGFDEHEDQIEESPKVFAILEDQFEQFKTDLTQ